MNIGQNIKKIRELKDLKQEAVAHSLGLSVTAYGDIERGKADLNFKRLHEIADVLEVDPETILDFDRAINVSNVNNNDNGIVFLIRGQINQVDKALYEKMLKDKDIAFLKEQVAKLTDALVGSK
jgi:transcriptional regulator with XRE-family HTH domain